MFFSITIQFIGRFPQISGMQFAWNPNQPAGKRVIHVYVEQADGSYAPIDKNQLYSVATNRFSFLSTLFIYFLFVLLTMISLSSFMRGGGNGYTLFETAPAIPPEIGQILMTVSSTFFILSILCVLTQTYTVILELS